MIKTYTQSLHIIDYTVYIHTHTRDYHLLATTATVGHYQDDKCGDDIHKRLFIAAIYHKYTTCYAEAF